MLQKRTFELLGDPDGVLSNVVCTSSVYRPQTTGAKNLFSVPNPATQKRAAGFLGGVTALLEAEIVFFLVQAACHLAKIGQDEEEMLDYLFGRKKGWECLAHPGAFRPSAA